MKPIICAKDENKENAYIRREIMNKHKILPEFFYNMIWIFFANSIVKGNYKIVGDKMSIKKKYPNHFC